MRISRSLSNNDHVIRFAVTSHEEGWQVRQEEDSETVSDKVYSDWHRVERALWLFDRKAAALRQHGWIDNLGKDRLGQQTAELTSNARNGDVFGQIVNMTGSGPPGKD